MTQKEEYNKLENMEAIKELLKNNKNIEYEGLTNFGEYGFSRTIAFDIRNNKYKIVWFCNYSTLIINNEIEVIFDKIEISGTWPNGYKNNLQLEYKNNVICIIPLEEYRGKE